MGVGVGVPAGLAVLAAGIFFFMRRRSKSKSEGQRERDTPLYLDGKTELDGANQKAYNGPIQEMDGERECNEVSGNRVFEVSANSNDSQPTELPSTHHP